MTNLKKESVIKIREEFLPEIRELIKSEEDSQVVFYLSVLDDWVRQSSGFAAREETHYHILRNEWERHLVERSIIPEIESLINKNMDSRVATLLSIFVTLIKQSALIT